MTTPATHDVSFRVWLGASDTGFIDVETWFEDFASADSHTHDPDELAQHALFMKATAEFFSVAANQNWQIVGKCRVATDKPDDLEYVANSLQILNAKACPLSDDHFHPQALKIFKNDEDDQDDNDPATLPIVELDIAAAWHCPTCQIANYVPLQLAELSDEEKEEAYRRDNELEAWQTLPEGWNDSHYAMFPNVVQCSRCGDRFRAANPETCLDDDLDDDLDDEDFYDDEDWGR